MRTVVDILEERIGRTLALAAGLESCAAIIRPTADAKFGDYQANGVMAVAKQLKTNPRKLAEQVIERLDLSDLCEPPEVAGPGFINLRLKPEYVASQLLRINAADPNRLAIEPTDKPQTVVVDFSSPNIAKEMHVGHLRSTIIGDCLCRLLEFEGHQVIRQNHIGDWGTQFGMLINYKGIADVASEMKEVFGTAINSTFALENTEDLYRRAKQKYDSDPSFAENSREYVVALQRGDQNMLSQWREIVDLSMDECQKIYASLDTTLERKHVCGESFYNDKLPTVVSDLKALGLASESDGAMCVFPEGFKTKEGEPLPFIVQKSDGAYLYATTDLAAIRYRVGELKADRIVYVTDARQSLHFQMLFKVADMAGWDRRNSDAVELVHVMFGSVLGENGKPLKTREGENVKLKSLLDEAVERAKTVVEEKNPDLPVEKKQEIAQAVGIGAVKYADYSNNRTSDYVFSFNKMLAMDGNTAPYMQYAYARIRSIERKAESKDVDIASELAGIEMLDLSEPAELDLGKHLARYSEAIEAAIADYKPNCLTAYLYELAQKFSTFYTQCPVLDAPPAKRPTRLLLCNLTAKTIRHGLSELLGIAVVEQM